MCGKKIHTLMMDGWKLIRLEAFDGGNCGEEEENVEIKGESRFQNPNSHIAHGRVTQALLIM